MKKLTTMVAGAALAAGLTATGLGVANAVTSTPTYHGCVVGTNRVLQNVHTKAITCPTGDLSVTWNQAGPQGAPGARGPQGAQGPPGVGTAGPAGLDEQEVAGVSGTNQSIANCPADHPYLLGGGFQTVPGNAPVQQEVIGSYPVLPSGGSPGGWVVNIESNGVDSVTAYAICAK